MQLYANHSVLGKIGGIGAIFEKIKDWQIEENCWSFLYAKSMQSICKYFLMNFWQ